MFGLSEFLGCCQSVFVGLVLVGGVFFFFGGGCQSRQSVSENALEGETELRVPNSAFNHIILVNLQKHRKVSLDVDPACMSNA